MKIEIGLTKTTIELGVSGIKLNVNLETILKDTETLDSFITIFNNIMDPIMPNYVKEELKDKGLKYDQILTSLKLVYDYMQLMEGLNAKTVINLTDNCKIKIISISDEITIDFFNLMSMYDKISKLLYNER